MFSHLRILKARYRIVTTKHLPNRPGKLSMYHNLTSPMADLKEFDGTLGLPPPAPQSESSTAPRDKQEADGGAGDKPAKQEEMVSPLSPFLIHTPFPCIPCLTFLQ